MEFADQMAAFDERRRLAGISDAAVEAETQISQATLSRWRNGHQQPSVDRWRSVQAALDKLMAARAEAIRGAI